MHREISQRELRNDSGAVLRDLVLGNSFTITRNGHPVGDLIPHKPTGGFYVPRGDNCSFAACARYR